MAADSETLTLTVEEKTPLLLGPQPTPLDLSLRRLESFLSILGFNHSSSSITFLLSFSAFLLLGVATPAAGIYLSWCSSSPSVDNCDSFQVDRFEIFSLVSEVSLAGLGLFCVSRNLSKYGTRRFLFVDQHHGQVDRFQKEYVTKIQDFFSLLSWWMLPCFIIKIAREIIRSVYIFRESIWRSVVVFLASVLSWSYLTTIFLSACILFNLVCNLQVIHFEDYSKLLERESDALVYLEEHVRLRYNLSKISHRFRIFLLMLFLFTSASQFVTLFQTTGYSELVNFTNAGNLAVSSVVQVVGVVHCLHSASKISHRAQGIASVASRWHALVTCTSTNSSQMRGTNSSGNLEALPPTSVVMDYSESDLDLDSVENITIQTNSQIVSYMSSYHKRQALVMYLQSNPGGITIFGWTVDRALVNTIFFIELSLVLFVLGKTVVFSAK
ncbi:uncharacterized protein M6B38_317070 [Iris pallida]|uniref:Gustatory receptor n=1 Tax=Iris pallida TaxID=29817 RepID=A0AAX6H2J8_IRIPA|nr:uncharacterized protein M6B38_334085 [Iris pallida]KAJ6839264.1 uncharacterized protein M6B38_317070 [Iris pallida]